MRKQLVYDLPTRLFHWLFAGFFLSAFVISKTVDDDSTVFVYHMLAGLMLAFLVVLRLVWGFFGTKHARFSGYSLRPGDLIDYMKGILTGSERRWAGHNPAASWAAVVMMVMALGLGVTGYFMVSASGDKEFFEEAHEFLANGFIVVAILHVTGIALHTLRHKEMIGLAMLDGKKAGVAAADTISSPRSAFGYLLIALVVAFGLHLFRNYDSQTGSLHFFGSTLQLGEGGESDDND